VGENKVTTNKETTSANINNRFTLKRGFLSKCSIRRERNFSVEICLPADRQAAVLDVLNSIETDELSVYNENQYGTLDHIFDEDNEITLDTSMCKKASIRRWLPAACQVIRYDVGEELPTRRNGNVLGQYKQNAHSILFPVGTCHSPPGPAAFVGEIVLSAEFFQSDWNEVKINQFKFVVAHELVHAFDFLKILVPAFTNWPRFWRRFLEDGDRCENAQMLCSCNAVLLDDYGKVNELRGVQEYWPSRAQEWAASFYRR
jgi:hypothetical protein